MPMAMISSGVARVSVRSKAAWLPNAPSIMVPYALIGSAPRIKQQHAARSECEQDGDDGGEGDDEVTARERESGFHEL